MSNMSYCRFENTTRDLEDCYDAIENREIDELSDTEVNAIENMLEICKNILTYEDDIWEIINENK